MYVMTNATSEISLVVFVPSSVQLTCNSTLKKEILHLCAMSNQLMSLNSLTLVMQQCKIRLDLQHVTTVHQSGPIWRLHHASAIVVYVLHLHRRSHAQVATQGLQPVSIVIDVCFDNVLTLASQSAGHAALQLNRPAKRCQFASPTMCIPAALRSPA